MRAFSLLSAMIAVASLAGCPAEDSTSNGGGVGCSVDDPSCVPQAGAGAGTGVPQAGAAGTGAPFGGTGAGTGVPLGGAAGGDVPVAGMGAGAGVAGTMPIAGTGAAGMETAGEGGSTVAPAPNETCYEFRNHAGQTATDTTPYTVRMGENYEQFYYEVPWGANSRGTSFGIDYGNQQVLHHWLLYTSSKSLALHGTHETVIGTVLDDPGATLLAGWAVGGPDALVMPNNVEMELPPPGTLLNVQWHFFNYTNAAQTDRSAVVVCTVPSGAREHTASLTWLGTENFNGPFGMPPGFRGDFGGTCLNDSSAPITIFDVTPHMHQTGRHMKADVRRANGTMETVFDQPFDFNFQINYPVNIVLQPGDRITTTCTFHNTSDRNVPFGPSSNQEMCYLFANSYPAGELANGVFNLAGAANACW